MFQSISISIGLAIDSLTVGLMSIGGAPPVAGDALLLEDGFFLLLEDGSKLLLE